MVAENAVVETNLWTPVGFLAFPGMGQIIACFLSLGWQLLVHMAVLARAILNAFFGILNYGGEV